MPPASAAGAKDSTESATTLARSVLVMIDSAFSACFADSRISVARDIMRSAAAVIASTRTRVRS